MCRYYIQFTKVDCIRRRGGYTRGIWLRFARISPLDIWYGRYSQPIVADIRYDIY